MKITILGYADQGKSAYDYWSAQDNEITICDNNESLELPDGAKSQLGEDYLKDLDKFDLLVRTPSLHPQEIVRNNSPDILEKVTTNTNEFLKVCPTKNIIGVTGTKGKGTTSTLITKMLEAAGKKVHLGGNIGIPPLDLLKDSVEPDDWVILELANFQLIDIRYSPRIALVLMVEAEHMDWHVDVDEYISAKQQMFKWQKPEDKAIYFADNENSKKVAEVSIGQKIPYSAEPGANIKNETVVIDGTDICKTSELMLLGRHNLQNVCAAVTATWQITQDKEAIKSALTSFSGLPHRLELVREINDVKYYDDSFGTTPSTAKVAIEAFKEPKVVILGGSDKGATFEELAQTVLKGNVRAVVAIGDTGPAISKTLNKAGFINIIKGGDNMPDIVKTAHDNAKAGDIVLLSTGCASFGLFKNYKDRGEQFKKAVLELS